MTHAIRSGRRGSGIWVNKQRKVGGGGLLEVMQEKAIRHGESRYNRGISCCGKRCTQLYRLTGKQQRNEVDVMNMLKLVEELNLTVQGVTSLMDRK